MQYHVIFDGWGSALPFPKYQREHDSKESASAEARRVLELLPEFRTENADGWQRLPAELRLPDFPPEPDRAIVFPDPHEVVRACTWEPLEVITP